MGIEDNEKTSTRGNRNYELSGKIMLCTVILLFFAVIVILCLHSYWLCNRRGRRIRRLGSHRHVLPLSSATGVTPSSQGLSLSILQVIPSFVYSSSKSHSPLECAVCLSQFEDNEKGRVLPKCCHVFHVDCIDVWFLSHSNCPLCRAPVCPDNLAKLPREISAETAARQSEQPATELELSPRLCQSDHEGEDIEKGCSSTCSSSSSSLSPVSSPRKPMELVGITVEAPRGFNHTSFSSLQGTKFNSPGPLNRTRSI